MGMFQHRVRFLVDKLYTKIFLFPTPYCCKADILNANPMTTLSCSVGINGIFLNGNGTFLLLNCLTKRYKFLYKVLLLIFIGLGENSIRQIYWVSLHPSSLKCMYFCMYIILQNTLYEKEKTSLRPFPSIYNYGYRFVTIPYKHGVYYLSIVSI